VAKFVFQYSGQKQRGGVASLEAVTRLAVTSHKSKPLPSSIKESCQNMADFYAQVMSDRPIPSWSGSPSSPLPPTPLLDDAIRRANDSDERSEEASELDHEISVDEITRHLRGMKGRTAPGDDGIPAAFLHHAPPSMIAAIHVLFNASWSHGVFPSQWKLANAFTIFKKGDRSDPSSYRVISITSTVARTFERIVKCRVTELLEKSKFFAPEQAGFRHRFSTHDHIYNLQRDIHAMLNVNKCLPVLFLDIVKAFDRVPHDRLLYKLRRAGVGGRAWRWIRAFLTDRRFYVSCGGVKSDPVFARAGVPQGTVLAPLLFLIYINDLFPPSFLSSRSLRAAMFADDVCAWPALSLPRLDSRFKALRVVLERCTRWSVTWRLEFSVDKSQIVLFHRKRNPPDTPAKPLMLCDRLVSFARSYKYLGVVLDANGSFRTHITQLIAKIKHTAYQISRIFTRHKPPTPIIALKLVKAILIPQFTYGIQFITTMPKHIQSQIMQVVARPLRRALGLTQGCSAQRVLWEYGLPDIGSYHARCVLQFYNRSYSSLLSDSSALQSLLARDVQNAVSDPTRVPSLLPLSLLVRGMLTCFPSLHFPLNSQSLDGVTAQAATSHWDNTAAKEYRALKPCISTPLYLSADPMPTAVIRGRVRLGVALSVQQMCRYRRLDSPVCPRCHVTGDLSHLLLVCPVFSAARSQCVVALSNLFFSVPLTMGIICGEPPTPPDDRVLYNLKTLIQDMHLKCLNITGLFLRRVSATHFL
jgi:hypothetical protein